MKKIILLVASVFLISTGAAMACPSCQAHYGYTSYQPYHHHSKFHRVKRACEYRCRNSRNFGKCVRHCIRSRY